MFWIISPYHTGSHRSWAQGYISNSRHQVVQLTMAGRFWKWRMQGGAMELAAQAKEQLAQEPPPRAVLATDMLNLPAWLGLLRGELPQSVPIVLYMHENQLTYPWRPGEDVDLTYAMINWLSQLAADRVVFNSVFHRDSWFGELPRLLKHFPDYNHLDQIQAVQSRSSVLPVGVDCPEVSGPQPPEPEGPALILWNQRWEYDKRPDRFFSLLYRLQEDGTPFRLAVAGENFRNLPEEFEEARHRLADRIVHWGYVEDSAAYQALLNTAGLVISTTDHEFFGVSVLEAIAAGAFPLLPERLSYPELIPVPLHPACLYKDEEDLYRKASNRLQNPRPAPPSLRTHVSKHFAWATVAHQYDEFLASLAGGV